MAMRGCPECTKPLSTAATSCQQCVQTFKRVPMTILKALLCGLTVIGSFIGGTPSTSTELPTVEETEDQQRCRAKLDKARRLDVLRELEWMPGRTPTVVVGPAFFLMPFHAKQGFAATVNCSLLSGTQTSVNFPLLDSVSHREIGEWKHGRLKMS